jgi:hypothetical protein
MGGILSLAAAGEFFRAMPGRFYGKFNHGQFNAKETTFNNSTRKEENKMPRIIVKFPNPSISTDDIENLTKNAKLISTESGRTSRVGYREMYRLADKRFLSVTRDSAQDHRIVEWKITKTKPAKWNVSAW